MLIARSKYVGPTILIVFFVERRFHLERRVVHVNEFKSVLFAIASAYASHEIEPRIQWVNF